MATSYWGREHPGGKLREGADDISDLGGWHGSGIIVADVAKRFQQGRGQARGVRTRGLT